MQQYFVAGVTFISTSQHMTNNKQYVKNNSTTLAQIQVSIETVLDVLTTTFRQQICCSWSDPSVLPQCSSIN